jgi:uncharacterized membrane protein
MKANWTPLLIVAALAAAAITYIFLTSASLPDHPATHFNVRGEPNAAMSRDSYRAFMAFLVVVIPLLIAGIPALLARRWPMLLNIPNREFWMAPERIDATLVSIRTRTAILAAATIALQCFVHVLLMNANAAEQPRLDQQMLLIAIGTFAVFMIGWIVSLYRRFKRT